MSNSGSPFCGGVLFYCVSSIGVYFFGGNIVERKEITYHGRLGVVL